MKRSEMLYKLKEQLLDTQLAAWANAEACLFIDELAEKDAEIILSFIEKTGLINASKFGATCSRCENKSWEGE
jgi:hypothetical protein